MLFVALLFAARNAWWMGQGKIQRDSIKASDGERRIIASTLTTLLLIIYNPRQRTRSGKDATCSQVENRFLVAAYNLPVLAGQRRQSSTYTCNTSASTRRNRAEPRIGYCQRISPRCIPRGLLPSIHALHSSTAISRLPSFLFPATDQASLSLFHNPPMHTWLSTLAVLPGHLARRAEE